MPLQCAGRVEARHVRSCQRSGLFGYFFLRGTATDFPPGLVLEVQKTTAYCKRRRYGKGYGPPLTVRHLMLPRITSPPRWPMPPTQVSMTPRGGTFGSIWFGPGLVADGFNALSLEKLISPEADEPTINSNNAYFMQAEINTCSFKTNIVSPYYRSNQVISR